MTVRVTCRVLTKASGGLVDIVLVKVGGWWGQRRSVGATSGAGGIFGATLRILRVSRRGLLLGYVMVVVNEGIICVTEKCITSDWSE